MKPDIKLLPKIFPGPQAGQDPRWVASKKQNTVGPSKPQKVTDLIGLEKPIKVTDPVCHFSRHFTSAASAYQMQCLAPLFKLSHH